MVLETIKRDSASNHPACGNPPLKGGDSKRSNLDGTGSFDCFEHMLICGSSPYFLGEVPLGGGVEQYNLITSIYIDCTKFGLK